MSNILLFGGAFDPPHYGHIAAAKRALQLKMHEEVWWLPSASDAFGEKKMSDGEHRFNMLSILLAIAEDPRMFINRFELNFPETIGTYATVIKMKEAYPQHEFSYLIGTDQAERIREWRNSRELTRIIPFVVIRRNGEFPSYDKINWATIKPHNLTLAPTGDFNISSTKIRDMIRSGQPPEDILQLIPEQIYQYILKNKLYKGA
jgi:nicotinate-nucleotide adenylyltransferase